MRKLTFREKVLLALLAVAVLVCGYIFAFHLPMEERTARLENQILENQDLLAQTQAMADRQREMEAELEALRARDPAPRPMPDYDNLQAVMVELNRVLADAQTYTLSFSSARQEGNVMVRRVDLPFTCSGYAGARAILQRIHDSSLRCRLEDLTLTQAADGSVQVGASVVFYEYAGGDGES